MKEIKVSLYDSLFESIEEIKEVKDTMRALVSACNNDEDPITITEASRISSLLVKILDSSIESLETSLDCIDKEIRG